MKKILVKKLNNKKAITLISLVVTIVILVILAAVVINMTIGNNGLFNKTKLAKSEYVNASEKERKDIDVLTNDIDASIGNSREKVTVDKEEYEALKQTVSELSQRITNNEKNAKYHKGDIVTESKVIYPGYVHSGPKNVNANIILSKDIGDDVETIEISSTDTFLRGSKGFLYYTNSTSGSFGNINTYFTVSSFQNNKIFLVHAQSTNYDVTNNTPVTLTVFGLRIEFK